jgi:hypothetical protein
MSGFGVKDRLFTTTGNLYAKLFIPQQLQNALAKGETLAKEIAKAYRAKRMVGSVWYREVRIQELPMDKGAYRLNVIANYTYDERG